MEILIYASILAILVIAVVRIVLTSSLSVSELNSDKKIVTTGQVAMEAIIREIRQASDVTGSSVFSSNPGVLSLRTVQSPGSQVVVTRDFSLASGRLYKQDDIGGAEYVTAPETPISGLTFWHSSATSSSLITIQIIIGSKTFYGSAVLRSKY